MRPPKAYNEDKAPLAKKDRMGAEYQPNKSPVVGRPGLQDVGAISVSRQMKKAAGVSGRKWTKYRKQKSREAREAARASKQPGPDLIT